jgi:hypothetical protein
LCLFFEHPLMMISPQFQKISNEDKTNKILKLK